MGDRDVKEGLEAAKEGEKRNEDEDKVDKSIQTGDLAPET